jgi:putative nucleotidyltransferase with HDIG domain
MIKHPTITAVVLAAGLSQRMGRFKPLLPLGPAPIIRRVLNLFQIAGVKDILVVVGHRAAHVRQAVEAENICCVENPDYDRGMFTSVRAGIRALSERCRAFFIHPVDIPLVRPQTAQQLMAAFKEASANILYPTFSGRRGHPTLIDVGLRSEILEWPGNGGLSAFLKHHDMESIEVPVVDEAILLDLDTPEDYRHLQTRQRHDGLPSDQECRVLMDEFQNLPAPILAHCRAVSIVAQRLAQALHTAGVMLNRELVRTAALLHDIARTQKKNHAHRGADLLEYHGFSRLAPIVRAHMDLNAHIDSPIDETQVVYLADKLVLDDRQVDLEQRFTRKMEKFGTIPSARTIILERRENARRIQAKIERLTNRNIDTI